MCRENGRASEYPEAKRVQGSDTNIVTARDPKPLQLPFEVRCCRSSEGHDQNALWILALFEKTHHKAVKREGLSGTRPG